MRISVRLTPRGGRDALEGWARDDAGRAYLKARVRAAPTEGEANAALEALVAKAAGRPRSAVRVVAGQTARLKILDIEGLDEAEGARIFGSPED
ncbi:MAG: DUF167 domain-containing protein [Proteobacteria bacterium]|nr:DUF167 domain-containing protein [Pseudomonadota bacterium]